MIKKLNILSLSQARKSLKKEGFERFTSYYGVEIRSKEMNDLNKLVSFLVKNGCEVADLEDFFISYKIAQIGKEFDILRFGKNYTVNIELKSSSSEEKILKQLNRNRYYLKFLEKTIYNITFISVSDTLYNLRNGDLEIIEFDFLSKILKEQDVIDQIDVDKLFNPSDYLVSPFNSTERFLNGEFFLTHQQEDVKNQILNAINASTLPKFISITGGAGTGKTLLSYDIVRGLQNIGNASLIVHCGQINEGQRALNELGWNIIPIKRLKSQDLKKFDVILIDEAQRMYKNQFDYVIDLAKKCNINCIFSYDKLQTLAVREERQDISGKIIDLFGENVYSLSEKIRTNKEISNFIKGLLNNKIKLKSENKGNVQIRYFDSPEDVKSYISSLNDNEWKVLRFTPSQYEDEFHESYSEVKNMTSHSVIGQEFDGVAVVIDQFFKYNKEGDLTYAGKVYYSAYKMLFQNLTRARKRLLIIVLKNEKILERCLSLS